MNGFLSVGEKTYSGHLPFSGEASGEIVFTTAYTGYEEMLTDPSYAGQILVFAYPLIGNYGFDERRLESDEIQPEAVVVRSMTKELKNRVQSETVVMEDVDTRKVVLQIRESGSTLAGISDSEDSSDLLRGNAEPMSDKGKLGEKKSVEEQHVYNADRGNTVLLIDCGTKRSIVRELVSRDVKLIQNPCCEPMLDTEISEIDSVIISNGPGDPRNYTELVDFIQSVIGVVPVFGVCLGHQLIALAMNGQIQACRHGHRGVNQPVISHSTNRVIMTTQNHGYEVSEPGSLAVSHTNVNDDGIEGLYSEEESVVSVQYHPEGTPGPNDSLGFFDTIVNSM
jgi:carbamoyl-phosphate synthase small subunit